MAKFGELINEKQAVIFFYEEYNGDKTMFSDAISQFSNRQELNAIAIEFFKNQDLCYALRLHKHNLPVLMLYKEGEMIVREHIKNTQHIVELITEKL